MKLLGCFALLLTLVSGRVRAQAPAPPPASSAAATPAAAPGSFPELVPVPDSTPAASAPVAPAAALATPTPAPSATPSLPPDPKADTLVDCGKQKVAIIGHTESKDGHYALGWTLLPHRAKQPVDWKSYDHADPGSFIAAYPTRDDLSPGDYALVNGLLDLRAKRFTPLPTAHPYYPHKPDVDLHVAWSDDQHGTRFALVGNDTKPRTFNLWLVEASPRKLGATDLAPAATSAVHNFLHKQAPKQRAEYQTSFAPPDVPPGGKSSAGPFKGTALEIPFRAAPSGTDPAAAYAGTLTLNLGGTKVTNVQGKKVAP